MGIEYRIYKREPREYYDLDKARVGYAPGCEPPDLDAQFDALLAEYATTGGGKGDDVFAFTRRMLPLTDPGSTALWSLMTKDGNFRIFRLCDWPRNEMADRLYRGSAHLDSLHRAKRLADDLLRWAGTGECVLIPDSMIEEGLERVGFSVSDYRKTGSIFTALR